MAPSIFTILMVILVLEQFRLCSWNSQAATKKSVTRSTTRKPLWKLRKSFFMRRAREYEYPYFVLIEITLDYKTMTRCSGALIRDNWVLTAQQCILHSYWKNPSVHSPDNIKILPSIKTDDIALLKLTEKVPIGKSPYFFQTVPLLKSRKQFIERYYPYEVVGWREPKPRYRRRDCELCRLLVIDVNRWTYQGTCKSNVGFSSYCLGDFQKYINFEYFGGPAIVKEKGTNRDILAGIRTKKDNWKDEQFNSRYMDLRLFNSWINLTIGTENPKDECKSRYPLRRINRSS